MDTENTTEQQPEQSPTDEVKGYTPPATQADLDRIIESRLARERAKYADYDDLKARAEAAKAEPPVDVENATSEAVAQTVRKYMGLMVDAEARAVASELGFIDPADALAAIDRDNLPAKGDEPDPAKIREAVQALAEAKPYLVTKPGQRRPRGRTQLPEGEPETTAAGGGKPSAAAALRQLAKTRGK